VNFSLKSLAEYILLSAFVNGFSTRPGALKSLAFFEFSC
jgi:hypothetical protein